MSDLGLLVSAYIVDLIIGDPGKLPHPVRGIGWCIEKAEHMLRKKMVYSDYRELSTEHRAKESRERLAGIVLVSFIAGSTFVFFSVVSMTLMHSPFAGLFSYASILIYIYLLATTVATRELVSAGQQVIHEINTGHVSKAREKLGMIVGRDTESLDRKGIIRATIETLSENSSDGIIAPMFYFAIGGLPLAMTYKAINTLDSMVGYKNERYLNFGWASARLDDIANFVPARITGSIVVIASFMVGAFQCGVQNSSRWFEMLRTAQPLQHAGKYSSDIHRISGMDALRIMLRDGGRHASPNSGIPEAAMAGALGVKLGGPSTYGGVVSEKPFIGAERSHAEPFYVDASKMALTITKLTSVLGLFAALIILYVRTYLWS
ncbi:MAG: hypothetical protein AMK71_06300 [Nitrospira bacterium SG8_35_4]|nr:MAG: hypothetical protein AMK71_06300 [Nitrospira bacterium SG8_35_4]